MTCPDILVATKVAYHICKIEICLFLVDRRTVLSYITLTMHKFKNIIFNAL